MVLFLALKKAKKVVPKLTLRHMSIYIYTFIYLFFAVELLSDPSLGFVIVTIWSKFDFFNTVCQKTL